MQIGVTGSSPGLGQGQPETRGPACAAAPSPAATSVRGGTSLPGSRGGAGAGQPPPVQHPPLRAAALLGRGWAGGAHGTGENPGEGRSEDAKSGAGFNEGTALPSIESALGKSVPSTAGMASQSWVPV